MSINFICSNQAIEFIFSKIIITFLISIKFCNGAIGFSQTIISQSTLLIKSYTTSSDLTDDPPSFFLLL